MTLRLSLVSTVLDVDSILIVVKNALITTLLMWGSILPPADHLVHVG